MPYVPEDRDEEEQAAGGGQPPAELGQGPVGTEPTKSGFVNVDEYLSKNPNEGENLVGRVIGNLQNQKSEAQNAISGTESEFGQRVQSGTVQGDDEFLGRAFSSPENFVSNQDDVARFMAMRDAAYKGPNSLQETDLFAPTDSKVQSLKRTGESVGTEAGRSALLNPLSAKPTAGKTALNQLILQGTPNAAQRLEAEAKTFPSVEQQWQESIGRVNQSALQGKQTTDAAREATRTGLTGAQDAFKSALQQKVAGKTTERDAFNTQYERLNRELIDNKGLNLRPEDLSALGLEDDAFGYISKMNTMNQAMSDFGTPVNLGNYVHSGNAVMNVPTAGNVASQEDYAREAALQQLGGLDLGLADQMESPYAMNGRLPSVLLNDAFGATGTGLREADMARLTAHGVNIDQSLQDGGLYGWVPRPGYDAGLDAIRSQQSVQRLRDPNYYTSADPNAQPLPDIPTAPPPEGWDPNQPAPYPRPTSQPPQGMVDPQWNPYTGQWEGPRLMPGNPPPTGGGGGGQHFYSMGV